MQPTRIGPNWGYFRLSSWDAISENSSNAFKPRQKPSTDSTPSPGLRAWRPVSALASMKKHPSQSIYKCLHSIAIKFNFVLSFFVKFKLVKRLASLNLLPSTLFIAIYFIHTENKNPEYGEHGDWLGFDGVWINEPKKISHYYIQVENNKNKQSQTKAKATKQPQQLDCTKITFLCIKSICNTIKANSII